MAPKRVPTFSSEAEEQSFWVKNDSTEYIDWRKGRVGIFPELKPSTKTISLRLPQSLLAALKILANRQDVPYQSLMKMFLSERIKEEISERDNKRVVRTVKRGRTH
jgi:predicted DNA binding CopG/RHH family protein